MTFMPNADEIAGEVSPRVIREDDSYAWRERVWRFRRGWSRLGVGFSLLAKGTGDVIAGAPAAFAVAGMLAAVWLYRRVILLRLLFNSIIALHRVFVRAIASLIWRGVGLVLRPAALIAVAATLVLTFTPALDVTFGFFEDQYREIATELSAQRERRAERDRAEERRAAGERADAGVRPPDLSAINVGVIAARAGYALAVVTFVVGLLVVSGLALAYAGFVVFHLARAAARP